MHCIGKVVRKIPSASTNTLRYQRKQRLTKLIFTRYSLQTRCRVEIPPYRLCMKVSLALCTQQSFWDMCWELTTEINLVDISWYGTEFNPHLMALCSVLSAAVWGATAVQIIPFP